MLYSKSMIKARLLMLQSDQSCIGLRRQCSLLGKAEDNPYSSSRLRGKSRFSVNGSCLQAEQAEDPLECSFLQV